MRVCTGLAIKFWLKKFGHKCLQGRVQMGKMDIAKFVRIPEGCEQIVISQNKAQFAVV